MMENIPILDLCRKKFPYSSQEKVLSKCFALEPNNDKSNLGLQLSKEEDKNTTVIIGSFVSSRAAGCHWARDPRLKYEPQQHLKINMKILETIVNLYPTIKKEAELLEKTETTKKRKINKIFADEDDDDSQ